VYLPNVPSHTFDDYVETFERCSTMNKRSMKRFAAVGAAAALALGALTACSSTPAPAKHVTLTWWHNGTADPLKSLWASVAKEFEKSHPNVTVVISAIQNEDLQNTKIPNALRGNNPPDLFQQWGGGEEAQQAAAGKLLDLSNDVKPQLAAMGSTAAGWQVKGKTYGLPFDFGTEGFWYNKDLFSKAGITGTPTSLDDLNSDVTKLKAAGITPIAVGAKDQWPAAHYWFNFALRDCSTATMKQSGIDLKFTNPCFTQAGTDLQKLVATKPFQAGFLGTPAQTGAGSSAGLVANGQAAMELMGTWDPSVMGGLTADKKVPSFLGWFAFPSVPGGKGDASAQLGGGDGFSCSWKAPKECVELLQYIDSASVQKRIASLGIGLPVLPSAEASVTDPNMKTLLGVRDKASYVQLWLDVDYGSNVGGALNTSVTNVFAGQGTPAAVVTAITAAASQQ
jgi:raffinose/stachyose/melibiose transport system substrate-binding protein